MEQHVHHPLAFVAIQAALNAGNILRKGFGTQFTITAKTNAQNLVTEYDNAAETAIINYIHGRFPKHSFLAEESGASQYEGAEVQWIIDPLDGTMNFVRHIPFFAVSIAARLHNTIEIGVIYQPMTNELFVAQRGFGAYLNGTPIHVSKVKAIHNAIGATGFPYEEAETRHRHIAQFSRILDIGNPLRITGSAALNMAYVAAGRFDLYWGANLQPWDVAAGKLLIEEAGGRITHYDGSLYDMFVQPSIVATNALLHDELLTYLHL
jgi:myo-inositol-1(or 4)-monophosphatase